MWNVQCWENSCSEMKKVGETVCVISIFFVFFTLLSVFTLCNMSLRIFTHFLQNFRLIIQDISWPCDRAVTCKNVLIILYTPWYFWPSFVECASLIDMCHIWTGKLVFPTCYQNKQPCIFREVLGWLLYPARLVHMCKKKI